MQVISGRGKREGKEWERVKETEGKRREKAKMRKRGDGEGGNTRGGDTWHVGIREGTWSKVGRKEM